MRQTLPGGGKEYSFKSEMQSEWLGAWPKTLLVVGAFKPACRQAGVPAFSVAFPGLPSP